jgi:hypothetical protein
MDGPLYDDLVKVLRLVDVSQLTDPEAIVLAERSRDDLATNKTGVFHKCFTVFATGAACKEWRELYVGLWAPQQGSATIGRIRTKLDPTSFSIFCLGGRFKPLLRTVCQVPYEASIYARSPTSSLTKPAATKHTSSSWESF